MSILLTTAQTGVPLNVGMAELSTFAERLQQAIDRKKTNPNQIEVRVGITRQAIYAMLKGTTANPTLPNLSKLCEFLGVRQDWLANGELPMFPAPALDDEEIDLVDSFRQLSPQHQRDIAEIVKRWAEEDSSSSSHPAYTTSRNHRRQ